MVDVVKSAEPVRRNGGAPERAELRMMSEIVVVLVQIVTDLLARLPKEQSATDRSHE